MTIFTDEVRETVSPHKFGGSRKAAALYLSSLDSGEDEQTGDVEFGLWVARFGRHLLLEDSQGFVWCESFRDEKEAELKFQDIDNEYCDWSDSNDI